MVGSLLKLTNGKHRSSNFLEDADDHRGRHRAEEDPPFDPGHRPQRAGRARSADRRTREARRHPRDHDTAGQPGRGRGRGAQRRHAGRVARRQQVPPGHEEGHARRRKAQAPAEEAPGRLIDDRHHRVPAADAPFGVLRSGYAVFIKLYNSYKAS
ncbi:hypothetical protein SAMN05444392_101759 [Seinonella peptonophila]|uniref:Uncharacterized protein n=1 Tax=Seinonella peptonophila TaxID=112248 RepID=A0A1M4U1U7_9BACL|nr:hypothetical protein SAMN05444392_101759 [Seinonella peptonophila]